MWESTCLLPQQHLSTSRVEVFAIQLNKVASTGNTTPATSGLRAGLGLWRVYDFISHISGKWVCIGTDSVHYTTSVFVSQMIFLQH